jgi:hypothetical protein
MSLAKGDRVIAHRRLRDGKTVAARGQITGESRDSTCWIVRLDALKYPIAINKNYVQAALPHQRGAEPEVHTYPSGARSTVRDIYRAILGDEGDAGDI